MFICTHVAWLSCGNMAICTCSSALCTCVMLRNFLIEEVMKLHHLGTIVAERMKDSVEC